MQLRALRPFRSLRLVFPRHAAAIVLLCVLALNVVMRGIVPALSHVDSDFPSYFTAARIVADGAGTERLYDTAWFQEQMRRYRIGKPSAGKFAPLPPPTALLLLPLASLQPLEALRVVTVVSTLCLLASIVGLAAILEWSAIDAALLVLLSGSAVLSALRLGQPYILVSTSCILAYYAYLRNRPWLAGAGFGLFTPLKYFPVIFLGYFAFRRRWRVVAGGALVIAAVTLASIAILGWQVHARFLASVLGNHLIARIDMQDPFAASFQSFDTLFRRLFVFDATANPRPVLDAPLLQLTGVLLTKGALAAVALLTLRRLAIRRAAQATAPSLGLLGIASMLLAPATATYHQVLLWLPVGLLSAFLLRERAHACAAFLLGIYTLIGFFPYRLAAPFAGRGALTLLAFPRLLLLLAMFLGCVRCLWKLADTPSAARAEVRA